VAAARVGLTRQDHMHQRRMTRLPLVSRARQQRQRAVRPTYMPWNML
jgi:hypothetical protein